MRTVSVKCPNCGNSFDVEVEKREPMIPDAHMGCGEFSDAEWNMLYDAARDHIANEDGPTDDELAALAESCYPTYAEQQDAARRLK